MGVLQSKKLTTATAFLIKTVNLSNFEPYGTLVERQHHAFHLFMKLKALQRFTPPRSQHKCGPYGCMNHNMGRAKK